MEQDAKILITGANGMLGHRLQHALQEREYRHFLCPNHQELNALYGYSYQSLPLTELYFFSNAPHAGEYGYAMAKRHTAT